MISSPTPSTSHTRRLAMRLAILLTAIDTSVVTTASQLLRQIEVVDEIIMVMLG